MININDAVNQKDLYKIVVAVRAHKKEQGRMPPKNQSVTDLKNSPNWVLVRGLQLAAQRNYAPAMVALFNPHHALYVVENSTPRNERHQAGLELLKTLVDMFEKDIGSVNQKRNNLINLADNCIGPNTVNATIGDILQAREVYAQHQKISNEVQHIASNSGTTDDRSCADLDSVINKRKI